MPFLRIYIVNIISIKVERVIDFQNAIWYNWADDGGKTAFHSTKNTQKPYAERKNACLGSEFLPPWRISCRHADSIGIYRHGG